MNGVLNNEISRVNDSLESEELKKCDISTGHLGGRIPNKYTPPSITGSQVDFDLEGDRDT